jgi:indole-3-acetate monooxygenase
VLSGPVPHEVVTTARALGPTLRAASEAIERDRRLPPAVVTALTDAGVFRMCVPASLGGGEVSARTLVEVIEAIAAADGSAGWCTMIGATTGVVSAYLPETAAREIYGAAGTITGGVFAPQGVAVPTDGGYQVSGRWSFGSGCQHCGWLMGGCLVRTDPAVPPRMMIVRAEHVEIIDTWDTAGLRGTGSHDLVIMERFVPAEHSVSLIGDRPRAPGPLYRFPVFGLLALGIGGVALGIARNAIDALVALAQTKKPADSRRGLAERGVVQSQVATAEGLVRAARAFLFDQIDDAWTTACRGDAISIAQRTGLRLAATHATSSAANAVDLMYAAGGGSAIYARSPLQRAFRDIHTATAHAMVAPATLELTGRLLLGLPTDTALL